MLMLAFCYAIALATLEGLFAVKDAKCTKWLKNKSGIIIIIGQFATQKTHLWILLLNKTSSRWWAAFTPW